MPIDSHLPQVDPLSLVPTFNLSEMKESKKLRTTLGQRLRALYLSINEGLPEREEDPFLYLAVNEGLLEGEGIGKIS
jgi:hypothetical protein